MDPDIAVALKRTTKGLETFGAVGSAHTKFVFSEWLLEINHPESKKSATFVTKRKYLKLSSGPFPRSNLNINKQGLPTQDVQSDLMSPPPRSRRSQACNRPGSNVWNQEPIHQHFSTSLKDFEPYSAPSMFNNSKTWFVANDKWTLFILFPPQSSL